jgi:ribonucleoside-triphosphate reductase
MLEDGKVIRCRIMKKTVVAREDSYDITTDKNHNFFANGVLVHNSEILLLSKQFCNLSSTIVRASDSLEDLLRKVRIASILGTLQATLTEFRFLSAKWRKNTEMERLLGVSITGLMDHPVLNGSEGEKKLREWLNEMWLVATKTNFEWSERLGIPPAKAVTCVKPEGTLSQLADAASGIHSRFAEFYVRRVRNDVKDPLTKMMIDLGFPHEVDVMNSQSIVFSFPIRAPKGAMTRDGETAMDQLRIWKIYQEAWCDHKPSVTVSVREREWMSVGGWVYDNFEMISGISFLPYDGGSYKQAPYEKVDQNTLAELEAKMPKDVDWTRLPEWETEDCTTNAKEFACSAAGGCEI